MSGEERRGWRKWKLLRHLLVIASVSALAAACSRPAQGPSQVTQAASTQQAASAISPTARPTNTPSPTATSIPGFEGWSMVNPQDVEINADNGSLVMTLTHKALWFMEQRGVLLYKPVSGNFRITADVHTSKRSNTSQPPGGEGSVQLGGVMARNGDSTQENYVFIVVGDDGNGLSVETKNTTNSLSKFDGPDWGSPDAELRLCRFGSTVSVYKRHIGTPEPWVQAATYERADLPQTLEVGLNIYTDSAPDLQVRYDEAEIEAISNSAACGE